MKKIIIPIMLLIFLCSSTPAFAKKVKHPKANSVAKAIGYSLSNENFNQINLINVKTEFIKSRLQKNMVDSSFKLKSIILNNFVQEKKQLHVNGIIVHADKLNRLIQTRFDAGCTVKNSRLITIDSVKLRIYARPRAKSFIVPANAIKLGTLKRLSFSDALQQVGSVAKRAAKFDTPMDLEPRKYVFISFMMNKLNKSDKIISVMSDLPYNSAGKSGRLLKTSDGWLVSFIQTEFAYNNLKPRYFNIFWKTSGKLILIDSYSTHGMVKEMQTALFNKGYDVGRLDGMLSMKTKAAIKQYIKKYKFHPDTKISTTLSWFMQQNIDFNTPKIVQATLFQHGYKIGAVDGVIGANTIKAVKNYQKALKIRQDGKITPDLVYLLLNGSNHIDTFRTMSRLFDKPVYQKTYQNKKWPNQI
jgi:methionine salvage enolase-phosphatase E1